MATSAREELRKALAPSHSDEKARMVAYRMSPEKAKELLERMMQAGKVQKPSGLRPKKKNAE